MMNYELRIHAYYDVVIETISTFWHMVDTFIIVALKFEHGFDGKGRCSFRVNV